MRAFYADTGRCSEGCKPSAVDDGRGAVCPICPNSFIRSPFVPSFVRSFLLFFFPSLIRLFVRLSSPLSFFPSFLLSFACSLVPSLIRLFVRRSPLFRSPFAIPTAYPPHHPTLWGAQPPPRGTGGNARGGPGAGTERVWFWVWFSGLGMGVWFHTSQKAKRQGGILWRI